MLHNQFWSRAVLVGGILALALLPCLLPLTLGRAWNGVGPMPFGILNPPENYLSEIPDSQITAESWGASSVIVPFHARLRQYLIHAELPLWNPYQGLGQQFAAQGEGCPYFPVAILRALLPYTWANVVTIGFIYVAGLFFYKFLRGFDLSLPASLVGAVGYIASGALTLHLARPNIADQLATIPILFWAAGAAVRRPSASRLLALALAAAAHLLGGFIQIAMLSGLLCAVFCCAYAGVIFREWSRRLRTAATTLVFFMIGNGLAGIFLLPLLEAMQTTVNKNGEHLAFIPMPYANVMAFFFPYVFGPIFRSWIPGVYPQIVDWDNLFAFSGITLLFLCLIGWLRKDGWKPGNRALFGFFAGATVVLLLRYISFPPLGALNLLPILGRQSPKHANGVTVFVLAAAAAFACDSIKTKWTLRDHFAIGGVFLAMASCLLTMVGRQGGWSLVNLAMAQNALLVSILTAVLIWWALTAGARKSDPAGAYMVIFALVAESAFYLPLGNQAADFLWWRIVLFVVILGAGGAGLYGHRRCAAAVTIIAIFGYVGIVVPRSHLPGNVDLTIPPRGLTWLRAHAGNQQRAFGVPPEFSSIARVQSLDVLGPLAPEAYNTFVQLVTDAPTYNIYKGSYVFMLQQGYLQWRYPLALYRHFRPFFDAAGVRYLFLDRAYFGPGKGTDDAFLRQGPDPMRLAYEDDRVRIIESPGTKPRFHFANRYETVADEATVLAALRADPTRILGVPLVEATDQLPDLDPKNSATAILGTASFSPNEESLTVTSSGSGLLATNDLYDHGWQVSLNGVRQPLLRLDGIFRGVYVPSSGIYRIRFFYRPGSFVLGAGLSIICGLLLAAIGIWAGWSRCIPSGFQMRIRLDEFTGMPLQLIGWSAVCALVTLAVVAQVYFLST